MPYFFFLLYCVKTRFKFFTYSPLKKTYILEKKQLYFWAGINYMKLKNYLKAATCFENAHAYKYLIKAYEELGLYSKAIAIADEQKYYKIGIALCEHINNQKKLAYFHAYFRPLYAAKLYKKEGFFYEAGTCYLKAHQFLSALECFNSCLIESQKTAGLKQLEEIAIVLYFSKAYDEATKLFVKLGDYYSALECAKKLKEPLIINPILLLIANHEAQLQHYLLAGKCCESIDKKKALTYYYLGQAPSEAVRLLIEDKDYEKAIYLCIHQNNLNLAYELATTYDVPLDFSLASC